ncbi:MAG: GAF domain-containing protein [Solirubrobacteraceae bacterium]
MSASGNGHRRFARSDDELRRLTTLVQLSRDGEAASSEHDLLASALTTVAGILPGHAIAIALVDETGVQIPGRLVRGRMPIELATLVAAVSLDRGELVDRKEDDNALLALPLAGSRGPIGALVTRAPRTGITEADRAMLQAMAQQLSLTLDNLRLHRQLNRLLFRD